MQISSSEEIDASDFVTEVSQGLMEVGEIVSGFSLNFFRYRRNSDISRDALQHLLKPFRKFVVELGAVC